ncbi:endolytic transglycosylase MltG [Oxalobacter vibrioformis]|uniref:Endolytic murein transglycosylase n=1 Tax=Oxalobacter vibrioformis TaxID=933080 RepID=A0A9E9LWQ3_9BURK|nr:endolytic transglycosylase MltG [Oxalobacter vibrioformis]WAW10249.1 endolytic transglycosylase MltG [Oxalobacter vibrioformis]
MTFFKRIFLVVAVLFVLMMSGFAWWANAAISPSKEAIPFDIRPGGLNYVIDQLNSQGIEINGSLFSLLVRVTGNAKKLKAGSYEMKPGETPSDLMERLAKGLVSYESITIVEGWTFKQMREAMAAHPKLKHDTDHLTERELIEQLKITWGATEGLFFPSTYLFMRGASDMQIYRQAHEELMKRLYAYWEKRDPALPYKTPYEALVMASIVEKETGHPEDRAHIAGVFTNRLKIGMKLQTDPTVIYGMGDKYKGVIYKSSLTTDTPYNTYTRFGLPPTPIALVGDAALNATFNPAKTEALYFVSRADGTGKSEFTTNLADHNRAVDKFLRNK